MDPRILSTDRHHSYLSPATTSGTSKKSDRIFRCKTRFDPSSPPQDVVKDGYEVDEIGTSRDLSCSSPESETSTRVHTDQPSPDEMALDMEHSETTSTSSLFTLDGNFDVDFPSVPFLNLNEICPAVSFPHAVTGRQFEPFCSESSPCNMEISSIFDLAAFNEAFPLADSDVLDLLQSTAPADHDSGISQLQSPIYFQGNVAGTDGFNFGIEMINNSHQFQQTLISPFQTFSTDHDFGNGAFIFSPLKDDPFLSVFANQDYVATDFALLD